MELPSSSSPKSTENTKTCPGLSSPRSVGQSTSQLELSLYLDLSRTSLDQVEGFVSTRSRRRFSLSESLKKDLVSPVDI